MGNILGGFNLGPHLGRKDPALIAHWSRSGVEARKASPYRCQAIASKNGERCKCMPARGVRGYYHFCHWHLGGADRLRYDIEREARHKRTLALGDTPSRELRAQKGLKQIANTRMRYAWRHTSPEIPGTTLIPPDHIEPKVRSILKREFSIDIDAAANPETNHPYTYRCIDKLRHSAFRLYKRRNNDTISDFFFERISINIKCALKQERRYWAKHDKLERLASSWDAP